VDLPLVFPLKVEKAKQMQKQRFPSKLSALDFLRKNIEIGCIVDVGIQAWTEELVKVFPDKRHILFEPVAQYERHIRNNYAGLDYELHQMAVSNVDGTMTLHLESADASGNVTHSQLGNSPNTTLRSVEIPTTKLSSFLQSKSYQKPYLVKIDVDGHEPQIMEGLRGAEADVCCLIVEAPISTILSRITIARSLGMQLFDIVDFCYYKGTLWQVDLIFLPEHLINAQPDLHPMRQRPLDWSQWLNFSKLDPHP
jgi:FkbM family methyltransferase